MSKQAMLTVYEGALVPVLRGLTDIDRQYLMENGVELLSCSGSEGPGVCAGDSIVYIKEYTESEQNAQDGGLGFHRGFSLVTFFSTFLEWKKALKQDSVAKHAHFLEENALALLKI
eukprot:m.8566 g.8566  ORF g.8566 m.8566 type:complete len:116 (-) comp3923_c0_seq1:409-756(-)